MENDKLDQIWNDQLNDLPTGNALDIIKKANGQRSRQYITVAILAITVLILLVFSLYFVRRWNEFALGLALMISSMVFRVLLELATLYRKENQLISLDNKSFKAYLKKHYKLRLQINYFITPICFVIYIIGFVKLLPYFKQEFSVGFYNYLLISGIVSLAVIGVIVVRSVVRENEFLKKLNDR